MNPENMDELIENLAATYSADRVGTDQEILNHAVASTANESIDQALLDGYVVDRSMVAGMILMNGLQNMARQQAAVFGMAMGDDKAVEHAQDFVNEVLAYFATKAVA